MSSTIVPARTPWARVIAIGLGLSLVVGVILLAFSWPSLTASPRNLPIGIVGQDAAVSQVETAIADQADGAIDLIRYGDRDEAVAAIEYREAYGAIVLGDAPTDAPEVLKATAASAQAAGLLDGLSRQLQAQIDTQIRTQVQEGVSKMQEGMAAALQAAVQAVQSGQMPQPPAAPTPLEIPQVTVVVTDLAPYADSDPQGVGLNIAMFPLVIGGMVGGALLSIAVVGAWRRVVGVVVYAAAAGVVLTAILQSWLGALQADFWVDAAAIGLAIAAIGTTITGLGALLGRIGIGIGAAGMILFANPLSAATVPIEFLLEPWGAIGQWMPPGAAATLLRNLSYFPDADVSAQWLLLGCWTLVGLLLTALDPAGRRAASAPLSASTAPALV